MAAHAAIAAWVAAGNPSAHLYIRDAHATELDALPASVRFLTISNCPALRRLLLPIGLVYLRSANCPALRNLPSFMPLRTLNELVCRNCPALCALPPLPAQMTILVCDDCGALRTLPPLPPELRHLTCRKCRALASLPSLPKFVCYLFCYSCPALRNLPPLPAMLTSLDCDGRVTLPAGAARCSSVTLKRARRRLCICPPLPCCTCNAMHFTMLRIRLGSVCNGVVRDDAVHGLRQLGRGRARNLILRLPRPHRQRP